MKPPTIGTAKTGRFEHCRRCGKRTETAIKPLPGGRYGRICGTCGLVRRDFQYCSVREYERARQGQQQQQEI